MKTKLIAVAIVVLTIPLLCATGCKGFVKDKDYNTFIKSLGHTSVTAYPSVVRVGKDISYDTKALVAIAEVLRTEKLASVTLSSEQVSITRGWHMNQAKMLRESSQDLASHIAAHPIDTDYAIIAEYLGGSPTSFGGIQCNIVDKHGTPVFALVMNSHNKTFAAKNPKSPSDCTDVLLDGLRKHLAKHVK